MKINSIEHFPRLIKSLAIATPLLLATPLIKSQDNTIKQDVFVKTETVEEPIVADSMMLSPEIIVAGESIYPAIVVSLSENKLYHYDYDGVLRNVYPIAKGKKSTPTKTGLRMISHVEDYPYRKAGKNTKRYKNPNDYGPHVLYLVNIDTKTGKVTGSNGQFIHGTNRPNSIGKNVSKGCIRVHNDVIKELANYVDSGQFVLIKE